MAGHAVTRTCSLCGAADVEIIAHDLVNLPILAYHYPPKGHPDRELRPVPGCYGGVRRTNRDITVRP